MNPDDFNFYKKFLHEKSGLSIGEDKVYLLESRLSSVLRKWNIADLDALAKLLRGAADRKLVSDVVDAMTTNETLFFRDDRPFKHFRTSTLPALLKARAGRKSLRIWSAACSTGQEPCSIAMTLCEALPGLESWNIEIVGTDISDKALAQAGKGEFSQFEIQRGLPIQFVMKYFKQEGQVWKVADKIRKMIRYESFNLMDRMEKFGTFDIIFCRNVLIYFDEETKKKVLQNLIKRLAPDGYIFLGGSETVIGLCPELQAFPGCSGLYTVQKRGAAPIASAPAAFTPAKTGSVNMPAQTNSAGKS